MNQDDVGAQLRRGVVEACILGLLEQQPHYGWQLSETLIREGQIIGSIGTLYPVLTRLRKNHYVTTFDELSPEGRTRRYYRITPTGTDALERFRLQWRQFVPAVDRLITPYGASA